MNGSTNNNFAEDFEALQRAIEQPDYGLFRAGSHQPITEEELLQVAQPLRLGDEHLGEANYDALARGSSGVVEGRGGEEEDSGAEEGVEEPEEELGREGEGEEWERSVGEGNEEDGGAGVGQTGLENTVMQEDQSSESESATTSDGEQDGEGNGAREPPSPTEEEPRTTDGLPSGGQDQCRLVGEGGEADNGGAREESVQPEIAIQGTGMDGEECAAGAPHHLRESQNAPACFPRSLGGGEPVGLQVDLEGNLTAATKRELELREATETGTGEARLVNNPGLPVKLPVSRSLDQRMREETADGYPHASQLLATTSTNPLVDLLQGTLLGLCEEKTPFRIEDLFTPSLLRPVTNPPAPSQNLALAVPKNASQQKTGPCSLAGSQGAPHAVQASSQARLLKDVAGNPSVFSRHPMGANQNAPGLPYAQQRAAPTNRRAPKPKGAKVLGVQPLPMKGKASEDRGRRTCESVAQRLSEATGGRRVFMQDARRVRVTKMPRTAPSNVRPPRPPLYPTPPPFPQQPSPPSLMPPHGLEEIQRILAMKRRQPGSSASHAELARILNSLGSQLPRPAIGNENAQEVAPAPVGSQVSTPAKPHIPASGNASTTIDGHELQGDEQDPQGVEDEIVAISPMTPASTERKSVKRKLELTAEERQEKKRIRAIRNRQSAEKSRRRRKAYAMGLESNVVNLRGKSQEWRQSYIKGLTRLSEMQRDIREMYGEEHQISTPAMHDVVDVVGAMVGRCPFSFKREAPEVDLRNIGEDRRRGGRGRGGRGGPARRPGPSSRGGRGRGGGKN